MSQKQMKVVILIVLLVVGIIIASYRGANPVNLVIALLIVALAVCWIAFPLIVISKFNELLNVQREIHAALLSTNARRSETLKAVQWIVDKLAVMEK
jgi:hypothetical protein